MIVHGFVVVSLARLVQYIILKIKKSTLMRKIKKAANKVKKGKVIEFLQEGVYHATAITMIVLVSLVLPGQPIKEIARG
jgi:ketopantoate reductase